MLPFQPVVLWTDAFVYLLLFLAVIFTHYARRHEHLRAPWRRVFGSRTAMASAVVLAFYLLIGLLDTLHFKARIDGAVQDGPVYSTRVDSLFDLLSGTLREQREKTYSMPFATRLFSKETVQREGRQVREFPRLKYGGAHLDDPDRQRSGDILRASLLGMVQGALAGLALVVLFSAVAGVRTGLGLRVVLRRLRRRQTGQPWHVAALTFLFVMMLSGWAVELSGKYHILGTDKVGEDVFYQALKSIRTGLVIGTLTTLVMLPAAILLGIMAGYFRGWVDDVIQYLYTTLNSIPGVLLIAAAVLMMQIYISNHEADFTSITERADLRLLFLCMILGVTSWTGLCRLLRGEALKLRELEYVQAAQAFGVGHFTILMRHLLPNVVHIVLIAVVLDFSGLVLAEAVLSYINIGVDPSTNSWGNMINGARLELAREPIVWWSLLAAFVFMFVLVLAANLFSDVVRDAFDPRLREQQ